MATTSQTEPNASTTGASRFVTLGELEEFRFSPTVKRVLRNTCIDRGFDMPTVSVASFLHAAAALTGTDPDEDVSTKLLYAAVQEGRFEKLLDTSGPASRVLSGVVASVGLHDAVVLADQIRRTARKINTQIRRRYVVLAMLAAPMESIARERHAVLQVAGIDQEAAQGAIVRYCVSRLDRNDKREEWEKLLQEWGLAYLLPLPPLPQPNPPIQKNSSVRPNENRTPTPVAAGVPNCEADNPWANNLIDRADAGREASAFARMIMARSFTPPLAVGVFGNWGSGKSFFMRLVHDQISDFRKAFKVPIEVDGKFLTDVVQIRFNAWHYAETNLWASLVDHVFRELDAWAELHKPHASDQLFEQLATARQLTIESAELLVKRRRERDAADKALQDAQADLQNKRAELEKDRSRLIDEVWKQVRGSDDVQLKDAAAKLGIDVVAKNAGQLRASLSALEDEAERNGLYRAGVLRGIGGPLLLLAVAAATLGLPLLIEWIAKTWQIPFAPITAAVSGMAATLAGALGWVNSSVSRAIDYLRDLNQRFEQTLREHAQQEQNSADAAKAELQARETAVAEARGRFELSGTLVADALRDYHAQTGRGRVLRFVRERMTKGDYAKQLGFVATVRKDFEELDRLMREPEKAAADTAQTREAFVTHIKTVIKNAGKDLHEEETKKLEAMLEFKETERVFERIVLYVDDLDRCPPEKVIDVLQAVHLLLAFQLFVVFVAVDVRWLRHTLARHYSGQLSESAASTIATAGDYLEKIFQVPYWVRSMNVDATRSILRDRLRVDRVESARTQQDGAGSGAGSATTAASNAPDALASAKVVAFEPSDEGMVDFVPEDESIGGLNALSLTPREQAFMQEIAAELDGSPRRTLRFINTYRVLKAGLADVEVGRVEQGEYAVLLTLLALSIASDDAYPMIVQSIEEAYVAGTPMATCFASLADIPADDASRAKRAYDIFAAEKADSDSFHKYARLVERYTFASRRY